ncbi:NAD(P)/FAD-dependent oxidoreductase [Anaerolineales bacterium HSG25]|nr:NAD(P)/FAD-dependent oxidoreductase [Anaerolineales bacterium HSG25]
MKIAIIGAGIAGLAAAYDLAGAGHEVAVYESSHKVGGLASGFKADNWEWPLEHFYHHIFETDDDILDLVAEIGAKDKLFFPKPITSFYMDGQIYPFDSPLRVLLFPKLGLIPKIRFGLTALYLRFTKNWQALEQETAHSWLRRMIGDEAYHTLWEPMLIGKFGDEYKNVNMAWFWARIHKRSFRLGYFRGGFQGFVDALAETVRARQVTIHLNSNITKIEPQAGGGIRLQTETEQTESYDKVLATTSPHLLTRLAPTLPDEYLANLKQLKSMGAVVLVFALKHKLTDKHYWINIPQDAGLPYLALVEHTNYVDARHYGGDNIVYCGDYLPVDHEYFSLSKDELVERFLPTLSNFNPDFDPSWLKDSWLYRAKYAQPIPYLNHSTNIPAIKTPLEGLYWASMSQVYPWDRGTNYAVKIGRDAARLMK